jgi:hypothetical protein
MADNNFTSKKVAVSWDYLGVQLDAYKELLLSYDEFFISRRNMANKHVGLIHFVKSLDKFYLCLISPFSEYLEGKKELDIKIKDFDDLALKESFEIKKLLVMHRMIIRWAQSDGPLATINKLTDYGSIEEKLSATQ